MTYSVRAEDRASLDMLIQQLHMAGDGLTVQDFTDEALLAATQAARRVKQHLFIFTMLFLYLIGFTLVAQFFAHRVGQPNATAMASLAVWSFALGGIGAVVSVFLNMLRLIPAQVINTGDEFEVVTRVVLGCLFSLVLTLTLNADLAQFFRSLQDAEMDACSGSTRQGLMALSPFLLGYSITLVLSILEKSLMAVEIALGVEDRRVTPVGKRGQRRLRKGR